MRVALLQNRNPNRFPDGIALRATPAAGCGPVFSSFRVQRLSTRRKPLRPIANRSASHPATASGTADLGVESVQAPAASEADADRARGLPQNQMTVERFNDDCSRIPPPRMQPIRQSAHRVAAIPAQVSPHPNDNPSLTQAADLTAVATMPLHPHASTITRQLPALCTAPRPKLFNRWRPRTSRAQVLDGNSEAV